MKDETLCVINGCKLIVEVCPADLDSDPDMYKFLCFSVCDGNGTYMRVVTMNVNVCGGISLLQLNLLQMQALNSLCDFFPTRGDWFLYYLPELSTTVRDYFNPDAPRWQQEGNTK